MRKLSGLAMVALSGWLTFCAPAQENPGGILFSQHRQFRIPFSTTPSDIKQLQLFVSSDQGRTWTPSSTAAPDQKHLRFITDRDGFYWFTVQTTDTQGRLNPPSLEGAVPSLKVVIDSVPPVISLQPLPPRGNDVAVAWSVRDENIDVALPDALRLEYRLAGSITWLPLLVPPSAVQHAWNPQATGVVEVRLRVRDRAGNVGEATCTVSSSAASNPRSGNDQYLPQAESTLPGVERTPEVFNGPLEADRRIVNSKKITLNCEIKDKGPSGVSAIELWYTLDGRGWNRYPQKFSEDGPIVFEVAAEGLYGVTLIAKSGVGLGERPPQLGDRPQAWIEVDLTRPAVQLHNVLVGNGAEKGRVTMTWTARDKNLTKAPITLSYAEQPSGPWKAIAEKLPNDGRYVWQLPPALPYQFHVRVEASDKAGNIGESITPDLVKVDLSNPKVSILRVEPAEQ